MSYDFGKVKKLQDQTWKKEINTSISSQSAIFGQTIAKIKARTKNIEYEKMGDKVKEVMFPGNNEILESNLLNQIAEEGDKVVYEKFANFFEDSKQIKRPHRIQANTTLKDLKNRIRKLELWVQALSQNGIINENQLQSFKNQYENLSNELKNAVKAAKASGDIKLKNTEITSRSSLAKLYNSLNETVRIGRITERIAFLAEKGAAFALNNEQLDNFAEIEINKAIEDVWIGSARSATQISTKGMSADAIKNLKELKYVETESVNGDVITMEYKNQTYDKADFKLNFSLEDGTSDTFGVSLKTGGKAFGLQDTSRLAAYLSDTLFLENYTNNLLRMMGGRWKEDKGSSFEKGFDLARNMVIYTALKGYTSQGENQAQLMMHINTANKEVHFYSLAEAIINLINNGRQGVSIKPDPFSWNSLGPLEDFENNFINTTILVETSNISKMLQRQKS